MSSLKLFTFFLCLIVFGLFVLVFITGINYLIKLYLRLIKRGTEDGRILAENLCPKKEVKKTNKGFDKYFILCSRVLISLFLVFLLGLSVYTYFTSTMAVNSIPSLKVVTTSSMSFKNEKNHYLFDNNLDNQIQAFDLVVIHELPDEKQLEKYDIVVYKRNDMLLFHRIVNIEEPNEEHNERYFELQGDAVSSPDNYPVLHSQMLGVYENEKVPLLGSFVLFMQSPAGYLCILLVLFYLIALPIVERKLTKADVERFETITKRSIGKEQKVPFYEEITQAKPSVNRKYARVRKTLLDFENVTESYFENSVLYNIGETVVVTLTIENKELCAKVDFTKENVCPNRVENEQFFIPTPIRICIESNHQIILISHLIRDIFRNSGEEVTR